MAVRVLEQMGFGVIAASLLVVAGAILSGTGLSGTGLSGSGRPEAGAADPDSGAVALQAGDAALQAMVAAWENPPAPLADAPEQPALVLDDRTAEIDLSPPDLSGPSEGLTAEAPPAMPEAPADPLPETLPEEAPSLPETILPDPAVPATPEAAEEPAVPEAETAPAEETTPDADPGMALAVSERPDRRPERRAAPEPQPARQPAAEATRAAPAEAAARPSAAAAAPASASAPASAPAGGAGAGAGTTQAGRADALRGWGAQVASCIQRRAAAPRGVRQGGRVVLALSVARGGQVQGVGIAASSGDPTIDQAALRAAQRAGRCPAAPAALTEAAYRFDLPITIDLR